MIPAPVGPTDAGLAVPAIRLTELTDCGGCAAKLGADVLAEVLAGLGAVAGPPSADLVAGLDPPDDAAVYRLTDELAVIGTVDFFPPLVDDPATYGAIAAANACSDVFAMGGRVLFALSVAAFPEAMEPATMAAIVAGAAAVVREAGGTLAGGHTIRDPEPKFGLAVIGVAHPDRLLRKGGARPGDVLLLTKPLGTGLLVSGARQGRASAADLVAAIASMRRPSTAPRPRSWWRTGSGARRTSPASGCWATGWRWRARRRRGWYSTRRRCRPCREPSRWRQPAWRRAAPVTTGGSLHLRSRSRPASGQSWSSSPTTRRRAAGCSRQSRRTALPT